MMKSTLLTLSLLTFSASSVSASQTALNKSKVEQHEPNDRAITLAQVSHRVRPTSVVSPNNTYYTQAEPRANSGNREQVSTTTRLRVFETVDGWMEVRNGGGYRVGWIHWTWLDANETMYCSGHATLTMCRTIPSRDFWLGDYSSQGS